MCVCATVLIDVIVKYISEIIPNNYIELYLQLSLWLYEQKHWKEENLASSVHPPHTRDIRGNIFCCTV